MKRHTCLLESLKRSKEASKTLLLALNNDLDYYKMVIGTKFYAPQILEGGSSEPNEPPLCTALHNSYFLERVSRLGDHSFVVTLTNVI